jgi:hypothetical protein
MGDYLSARLIKTAELDPQGCYLFAAYPHGISAISGWVCFATEAAGFSRLFPGENWNTLHFIYDSTLQRQQTSSSSSSSSSAISGWVCFATQAAGISRLFPGEQQQQQLQVLPVQRR